jgi:hypothetical protein
VATRAHRYLGEEERSRHGSVNRSTDEESSPPRAGFPLGPRGDATREEIRCRALGRRVREVARPARLQLQVRGFHPPTRTRSTTPSS